LKRVQAGLRSRAKVQHADALAPRRAAASALPADAGAHHPPTHLHVVVHRAAAAEAPVHQVHAQQGLLAALAAPRRPPLGKDVVALPGCRRVHSARVGSWSSACWPGGCGAAGAASRSRRPRHRRSAATVRPRLARLLGCRRGRCLPHVQRAAINAGSPRVVALHRVVEGQPGQLRLHSAAIRGSARRRRVKAADAFAAVLGFRRVRPPTRTCTKGCASAVSSDQAKRPSRIDTSMACSRCEDCAARSTSSAACASSRSRISTPPTARTLARAPST
jgi:hypothetical protein